MNLLGLQSTINPNITLRLLMYITRIYEKILGDRNIYTTKKISIPIPEFFVLYNGITPFPDEIILKLSDSFETIKSPGIKIPDKPALELEVKVININQGRNETIFKKSKTLAGYSGFIGKIRDFINENDNLELAMKKAIKYCRDNGILKDFLEKNASEVVNMLMTEWNWDDALAVRFEDGKDAGREEVAKKALAEGASVEFVQKITGLSVETLRKIQMSLVS